MKYIILSLATFFFAGKMFAQELPFPTFSAEAHRGGRGLMPENTITAMLNAMTIDGITTLEMDTHVTKDGKVVVTHDDYLSPAFMVSPNGTEIPASDAKKYAVFGMKYKDLRKFDLGSKFYDLFPSQKKIKTEIPLLGDLINAVQADIKLHKRKQFFYNIETKCSEKGDGITNPTPEVFVQLLMNVIEHHKIASYVVIQSFDKRTIQIINKKYPNIKTSFLVSNKKTYEENISDLGFKPFIISPAFQMVDKNFVDSAHADGVKVIPWTANTTTEIVNLKALKVDGIISDYPDILVKAK
ncbi:glycerophosphodiester phosphodiesterase family protein [Pedobacter sandarakinus]|uniref:glycerophosphodiester phosphodiesterase family protein n=1 Tax=Pedobacter sandarakinus TaxID=353156 RepID=UPI0022462C97|nr:glycerophosphodiester phosphodiesterase family protein [Pedobacter sandarakinus]MCX2574505.1 glycerophosphodiester phosphodiesterase family protein [Pedobacter sandarakinus]